MFRQGLLLTMRLKRRRRRRRQRKRRDQTLLPATPGVKPMPMLMPMRGHLQPTVAAG